MSYLEMRDLLGKITDLRSGVRNIEGDVLQEVLDLVKGFQEVDADCLMSR